MRPGLHRILVLAVFALSPWHSSAVMAQEARFTHGAAEGGQVITNRSRIELNADADYVQLTSSALTVQLQPGESDLFVLEFDAECEVSGDSLGDYVSVQARVNGIVGIISSFVQPQDIPTDLEFCSADRRQAVSKSWAMRLTNTASQPVNYTFSIWWRVVDAFRTIVLVKGWLDNRTVRLTRYN